jgi:hypothetical protein
MALLTVVYKGYSRSVRLYFAMQKNGGDFLGLSAGGGQAVLPVDFRSVTILIAAPSIPLASPYPVLRDLPRRLLNRNAPVTSRAVQEAL